MSIEPKKKPCKGTTADTRGLGCGIPTYHRVLGLGKICGCYSNFLLTTEAGKLRLAKATLKATKPRKDLEKAQQEKKSKTSLGTLKKNVTAICHEYIRLRDKYKPCISCNEPWHSDFHAGHFYKAELFSSLKYNEDNIHGQCPGCNINKHGNESQYRVNLPNKIGHSGVADLDFIAGLERKKGYKWDRAELNQIRKYYQDKINQIKSTIVN